MTNKAGPWRAGALLATALALCWTGASPLGAAIGHPLGEADNHRWMWWRAARAAVGERGPWANLPEGVAVPLMDPANLPLYLPGGLVDPTLGWNLAALLALLLAGFGGMRLARELGAGDADLLAGIALMASPFLAGVIDFGITESWGVGWFALHGAALLRFAREGRGRDALAAGLCLGMLGLSGWYQALFALVLEGPLLLWVLSRGGLRRLPGLLLQGGLALGMALPAFLHFLERRQLWADRFMAVSLRPPPPREDWASLPILGTDLLNLVLPRLDADAPSKAVYLGLVLLVLAAIGLLRRPRQVAPLLLLALLPLALALGPWPAVAGTVIGPQGPAAWMVAAVPDLSAVSHWYRAVGAALPWLAVAAALGAASLGLGRRGLAAVAVVLVIDAVALGPTAWPRASIADDTPAALLALAERAERSGGGEEARGVVQLPFDNGRTMFSTEPARTYDRWQVRHGLPRSESYESVDVVLGRSALVAGWQAATGQRSTLPPEQRPARVPGPPLVDPAAVQAECLRLRGWGYRWVVLHRQRAVDPDGAEAAVRAALGPGETLGDSIVWGLDCAEG